MPSVCIIGAGWYGCHAALLLKRRNIPFRVFDREGMFSGASSKNQNRLHLGYHYPRSPQTIRECQEGYSKFLSVYGSHTVAFDKNYYFIHDTSKTPLQQYQTMFSEHTEVSLSSIGLHAQNVCDTVLAVKERFIDNRSVEAFLRKELEPFLEICSSPSIVLSDTHAYVNGVEYDFVLNCTNNQYNPIPVLPQATYETFCSFLYRIPTECPIGLTVMDGPYFSIYPYDIPNQVYTVTHVVHGIVDGSESSVQMANQRTELAIATVFPDLRMEYVGYFLSKKTKYDYVQDDRSLRWGSQGRYFSFSGGKITGIFEMEKVLKERVLCS